MRDPERREQFLENVTIGFFIAGMLLFGLWLDHHPEIVKWLGDLP